jgi:methylglutamate dehydrogenase subunit C
VTALSANVPAYGEPAQPRRLQSGGLVDRTRPLRARYDDRNLAGFAGDTLASALLAAGDPLVARSFKYHRPRGIFAAGSEEPNALVELRTGTRREPNVKATTIELYEGLEAASQNRWPSLRFDVLAANSWLAPFIATGFYYKTFMWPASFWERVYEPLIRRAAGLGRGAGGADPDHYEQANAFCDILVIGAGPSGLAAAVAAARAGARVIVCDEDFRFGGRLLADRRDIEGMPGHRWAAQIVDELGGLGDVRLLPRTTVFGVYDGGTYGALERVADHLPAPPPHVPRQRLWRIIAKRAVLAAGATERGPVFGGNDRPGVMLAAAMRTYANRFAVAAGRKVAIFTNNDDGWSSARDLIRVGVAVTALIDSRSEAHRRPKLLDEVRVIAGGEVTGTTGGRELRAITVRSPDGELQIEVDALGVSGGWNPNVHLACHQGGRPTYDAALAAFIPRSTPKGMVVVGAANGAMTLSACLAAGIEAGCTAAADVGHSARPPALPRADDEGFAVTPLWHVAGSKQKAFVDLQNDVTADDIAISEREGFRSVEHLKRYTTLGMATDQGRTANVNAIGIIGALAGRSLEAAGTTTYRPPYTPVAIGALAGHHRGKQFRPTRLTSSHSWAAEQGAVFVETGLWLRAQYFPRTGERDWRESVEREVRTVRSAIGFCDVSTLGKIDVQGRDAGVFLDRIYINTFSTLPVGRARYGVMLREDGFVLDDGTTARLAPDRFFMTTTTANAERVFQHMQFCHQVLWPELDVQMSTATDQWAQFSIAGPRARDTLSALVDSSFDIRNDVFPPLSAAELTVCGGIAARLFRISFSGELAFELGVPARYGDGLARALMQAGAAFGIAPYGTEALGVMRIEKGHIAGNEIDGRTTACDLGFSRMMSTKKDYVGRVLASRPALLDPERPCFIGFKPIDPRQRLRVGAHLVRLGVAATSEHDEGVITSAAFSPTCGCWIGLGLLVRGSQRVGERVVAADPLHNERIELEVCAPCFVDPAGERMHV